MTVLDKLLFEPRGGMFREFEGLTTHFEPRDPALYRELLPQQFDMPAQPVVTVFVADYVKVVPWPMTRYQEWSALLKCEWRGDEGWYSVTMPVTKWVPMQGGRYLGFPKYAVDEIALAASGQSRSARARYAGETQIALEFRSGITRPLADWERALLDNESFFKGDTLLLVPPGRGPRAQKIVLRHVTKAKWAPEQGMLRVHVYPSETWAALVPHGTEFPGCYNSFQGGINLIAEKLE